MEIKKISSIEDKTKIELLEERIAKQNSLIEYLSMMTDVDIPEEVENEQEIRND